jgi:hypothetical protein
MTATFLRLHHDARRDVKLRAVAASAGLRYIDVLGAWSALLIEASAARPRGWIREASIDELADDLEIEGASLRRIVAGMVEFRLLMDGGAGWHVRKWRERQGVKVDNTAAERKRRQRQRQRGPVTPVTGVTTVTPLITVTPVTGVTPCHGVTFQNPYIELTTDPASALRRETEDISPSTEARAERRAGAPKRGGFLGWLIREANADA